MARIGMKYPTYASIGTYTAGSAITYTGGKTFAHAIGANMTPNRRNNPLYYDDELGENDKGITNYTLQIGIDRIPNADRPALLGEEAVTNSATPPVVQEYEVNDVPVPYVGFGFVSVGQEDNVAVYEAYWFHRVQFALDSDAFQTKGEQIQWNTPTISGTGTGVQIDSSLKVKYYTHMNFTSETAAYNWLKGKAGIT